jgi:hypothetical protein
MEQHKEDSGLADALTTFQARWSGAYLEGWKDYWGIVADLAGSPGSLPRTVPAAYVKLVDASARYYKTVLDAGVELASRILPGHEPSHQPSHEPAKIEGAPVAPDKPLLEMVFEGVAGSKPARQFRVANKTSGPVSVSFELSELVSGEGERMRLDAELMPASFSFQPGEERVVECRAPVSASLVEGRPYRAILRAIGLPDMQVVLCVKRLGAQPEPVT